MKVIIPKPSVEQFAIACTPSIRESISLKQIPQELVVDLVVELDFRGLYKGAQQPWTTIGRGLLQIGVAALHILTQNG
jgi:hypothetical protein